MKRYGFWILLLATIGGLVLLFWIGGGPAEVEQFPKIGQKIDELEGTHLSTVDDPHKPYNTVPATSGAHLGAPPANDYNIYDTELKDEAILHGLEHGAVAIWYNSKTTSQQEVDQLKEIYGQLQKVANNRPKAYLIPRSNLEKNVKVALVAWGYLMELESIDSEPINNFYRGHLNKGPEQAP